MLYWFKDFDSLKVQFLMFVTVKFLFFFELEFGTKFKHFNCRNDIRIIRNNISENNYCCI